MVFLSEGCESWGDLKLLVFQSFDLYQEESCLKASK